jgi:WD40 repeat protein
MHTIKNYESPSCLVGGALLSPISHRLNGFVWHACRGVLLAQEGKFGKKNLFTDVTMVLTDRQRTDLHAGIYEYLQSRGYQKAAEGLREADPASCMSTNGAPPATATPLLEKKWTAIPRLQKKVLELERVVTQSKQHAAHRLGSSASEGTNRRLLPRLPVSHVLKGHSLVVTSVALHPVFTIVVSASEDGTIKVGKIVVCENHPIVGALSYTVFL